MSTMLMIAAITVSSLFSDHAVVQRGKPVPVWGWGAGANDRIVVRLGDAVGEGRADPDGSFMAYLPAMPAGGPYVLKVQTDNSGSFEAKDVYVGEVWLGSGQSNMERHIRDCEPEPGRGDHPLIREFTVSVQEAFRPQRDVQGEWHLATEAEVRGFSAVGYFFLEALSKEPEFRGVAMAFIHSSLGGSDITSWMGREWLKGTAVGARNWAGFERGYLDPKTWAKKTTYIRDTGIAPAAAKWHEKGFDDSKWADVTLPNSFGAAFGRKPFNGAMWVRKTVEIPERWRGRELRLSIGQVDKHDRSYVNGTFVGGQGSGYDTRFWQVTRRYVFKADPGKCVVAVRAWSFCTGAGFWGDAKEMFVSPKDDEFDRISLAGTWKGAVERDLGEVGWPSGPCLPPGGPCALYNAMIAPLAPYALKGFLWYQGCSSVGYGGKGYRELQNAMLKNWRLDFQQGDLPFACVQLAGIGKRSTSGANCALADFRFHQMMFSRDLPHTGYASAVDIGDEKDIHPKDKKTLGWRLSRWALAEAYGRCDLGSMGPRYLSSEIRGNAIVVSFTDVGGGLVAKDAPDGGVRGVYVAGKDRKFVAAEAKIVGDKLVVSSPAVKEPLYVRYAWTSFPSDANLWNREGLPASCFTNE